MGGEEREGREGQEGRCGFWLAGHSVASGPSSPMALAQFAARPRLAHATRARQGPISPTAQVQFVALPQPTGKGREGGRGGGEGGREGREGKEEGEEGRREEMGEPKNKEQSERRHTVECMHAWEVKEGRDMSV